MARLNLSPPWDIYYRQISAMFAEDPEVLVVYDDVEMEIKLYVDNPYKADALGRLLPEEKSFGNVKIYITIVPSNKVTLPESNKANASDIAKALEGNGAVYDIREVDEFTGYKITFVIFTKKVIQYFTDNIGDWHGLCSTLYQDLAKDVFGSIDGVYYCTDNGVELLKAWI